MRNWNTISSNPPMRFWQGFHLTYEELKLLFADIVTCSAVWWFSSYLWGIETGVNPLSLDCRNSFHLTYEELKHFKCAIETLTLYSVFILPMRNWNPFLFQRTHWTVLWFSSYLWGIETIDRPYHAWFWNLCFHLTYEELKHFLTKKQGISLTVFILPMRNWNTVSTVTYCSNASKFSSYLWGIETVSGQETVIDDGGFHLTYEELKLVFFSILLYFFIVFILPMRNWNKSLFADVVSF